MSQYLSSTSPSEIMDDRVKENAHTLCMGPLKPIRLRFDVPRLISHLLFES